MSDHVIVLPGRLIKNSENRVKPDEQQTCDGTLLAPTVDKHKAKFAPVFVAKLSRVQPQERLIEAEGSGGLRLGSVRHFFLGAFANQAGGTGIRKELFEVASFFHGGTAADFGEAVVASAFVVVLGIGTFLKFFDEALFEEALDGAVKRAGTEANFTASPLADFLHYGIAVAVTISEGYENMKSVPGKKKGSHAATVSEFAIADKGVF